VFEYLSFIDQSNNVKSSDRPFQLIIGNSGVELNSSPTSILNGFKVAGEVIQNGMRIDEFGFMILELKEDGTIDSMLFDSNGNEILKCVIDGKVPTCN